MESHCDLPRNIELEKHNYCMVCLFPQQMYKYYQSIAFHSNDDDEFDNIIEYIKLNLTGNPLYVKTYLKYMVFFYKMTAFVRDIEIGYGKRDSFYGLVCKWYEHFPDLSLLLLDLNVKSIDNTTKPLGSWKDINYLCQYVNARYNNKDHPLILYAIYLMINEIKKDIRTIRTNINTSTTTYSPISLAGKWAPREKSKFEWIFKKMACLYFPYFFNNNNTDTQNKYATTKCFMKFRQICSCLNKKLNTLERIQSDKRYDKINIHNLTSDNLISKRKWLLNITHQGDQSSINQERINLGLQMQFFIENSKSNNDNDNHNHNHKHKHLKNKQYCIVKLVKAAWEYDDLSILNNTNNKYEGDLLNIIWKHMCNQIEPLINILPIIDSSFSMDDYSFYRAIGFGLLICEKSSLGKKILVSNVRGFWINLEKCDTLLDMIKIVKTHINRVNSNLLDSYKLICRFLLDEPNSKELLQNMNLLILSNLTFDSVKNTTFMSNIYDFFIENKQLPSLIPKTIFWAFSGTQPHQHISGHLNSTIITGGNINMINLFWSKKNSHISINFNSQPLFLKYLEKHLRSPIYKLLEDKSAETMINMFLSRN